MNPRLEILGNKARDTFLDWWQRQHLAVQNCKERVEELYGETGTAKASWTKELLPPRQGLMKVTHFPGFRGVKLPTAIWHDRIGVICNGGLPLPAEHLPEHVAKFKADVALRYVRRNIEMVTITSDGVQIDVREGTRDFVDYEVYRGIAGCLFGANTDLVSVRLQIDDRAPERRYDGLVIARSTAVPPPDPA